MYTLKKNSLFGLLIFFVCMAYGQTGPGGVGTTDGTSALVLWLDANTMSGTSGSVLTEWSDQSGNGYDFSNGNGAVFNTGAVNTYPAFNFNGSTHYFERPFTAGLTPNEFTIFSASNVSSLGTFKALISNRDDPSGSATAGFILYSRPGSNVWQFWTGRAAGSWEVTSGGSSTAGSWAGQMMEYENTTNGKIFNLNGAVDATSSHSMTLNPSRPIRVGAGRNETAADYFFAGDIGEVIMYNSLINDAQKLIVDNYLAAKYGYSLSSGDLFNEDDASSGNFDHDVAGIGRVDATNLHTDAQGTGLVRVLNPTDLDDDEFMMWGHDNGAAEVIAFTDVPIGLDARFERIWRVSEVNVSGTSVDVGEVDIRIDLSGLGSITASDLRLVIDTDNDGAFNDETGIAGATSLGSGVYEFSGIDGLTDNLRFTMGTINWNQTPLPIELLNFDAEPTRAQEVELTWSTLSESNNDFFTIEKSENGTNWNFLAEVDGAGNSTAKLDYRIIDPFAYKGLSYYRLKQTDFDGTEELIEVETVLIDGIILYPNPAGNLIHIAGFSSKVDIHLFDILGRNVTEQVVITDQNNLTIKIGLDKLEKGTYFVEIDGAVYRFMKR